MRLVSTQYTLSNGAFELYIAGCKKHPCKQCHSPELWNENIGTLLDINGYENLKYEIQYKLPMLNSIHLFGGEILEKPKVEVMELLLFLKQFNLPIWLYTRFSYDEINIEILNLLDYVKCGKYIPELQTNNNIQHGVKLASSNQQIYKVKQ